MTREPDAAVATGAAVVATAVLAQPAAATDVARMAAHAIPRTIDRVMRPVASSGRSVDEAAHVDVRESGLSRRDVVKPAGLHPFLEHTHLLKEMLE